MEKTSLLKLSNPEPLQEIDSIAAEYQDAQLTIANRFGQLALTVNAISELRKRLPDALIDKFKMVENNRLGFLTDNPKGYPIGIVRDCLIEATLRGLTPFGNEFNIIAGNCYVTKDGFVGLMRRDTRFADVRIEMGVPKHEPQLKRAIVDFKASWSFGGKKDSMNGSVPVRMNAGMGDDGALGKAERKIRARIYNLATGSNITDGEATDEQGPDTRQMRQVNAEVRTISDMVGEAAASPGHVEQVQEEAEETTQGTSEAHEKLLSLMRRDGIEPDAVIKYAVAGGFCSQDARMIEDIATGEAEKFVNTWGSIASIIKMRGGSK